MIRSLRSSSVWALCLLSFVALGCGSSAEVPSAYLACTAPQVVCVPSGGVTVCADLATDLSNCGACGNVCTAPLNGGAVACEAGQCVPSCGAGAAGSKLELCSAIPTVGADGGADLKCTDVNLDIFNCGACGTVCKSNEKCEASACVPASADPSLDTTMCGTQSDGGGSYKDLAVDPQNCGECGQVCGSSDVCQAGVCNPCPVAVCNNTCVDTRTDPKNCGGCGVVAPTCDQGVPRTKLEIIAGLPASKGFVPRSGAITQVVQIKTAIRVALVQLEAKFGTGLKAAPLLMSLASPSTDLSPTTWTVNVPVPGGVVPELTDVTFTVTAVDEQYRIGRADSGDHISSLDIISKTLEPTASFNSPPSVKLGAATLLTPTSAGDTAWVPLNAPKITVSASVIGTAAKLKKLEFRVNNVPNPSARADVVEGQSSTLDLFANDLGVGNQLKLTACAIDLWGNTVACSPFSLINIGTLTAQATTPPPIIVKGTDGNATIFSVQVVPPPPAAPTGYGLFAQPADQPFVQLGGTRSDLVGAQLGSDVYLPGAVFPTAELTGVLAVKKDGTGVHRIDCGTAACLNAAYVVPVAPGTFKAIEAQGISKVALALVDQATNKLIFAKGAPTGSDTAPLDGGGPITQLGSQRIAKTEAGALVAWVMPPTPPSPSTPQLDLYHPAITSGNNGLKVFSATPGATPTGLTVFPGGEMIWEYTNPVSGSPANGGDHYLVAAYFDGTNQPVVLTQPFGYGRGVVSGAPVPGYLNLARDFFVPKPGILVGRVPTKLDALQYEYVEINLTVSPPTAKAVAPFTSQASNVSGSTNILVTNSADFYDKNSSTYFPLIGVTTRSGNYAVFSTSDDLTKVLFSTRDTTDDGGTGPFRAVYGVNLLDLATSNVERVYTSENILDTALPFRPRFVRAAVSYTPEQPLTGAANAVVWGELLPVNTDTTGTLFFRPFVATWGTGSTTPHELNPLAFAKIVGNRGPAYFADSAAAKAVIYLSSTAEGRFDLEQGTFAGASSRVMSGVTGFEVREDKASILVQRNDGVLFVGSLANGVTGLTPILSGLSTLLGPGYGNFFGFTPDGGHVFALVSAEVMQDRIDGTLLTLELATGARTNWGRVSQRAFVSPFGFLDGAKTVVASETFNRNTTYAHVTVASSDAPMKHEDTLLVPPPLLFDQEVSTSVDGSELLFSVGNKTAAVRKDKTVLLFEHAGGPSFQAAQAATYSPYGGPYLPDWGVFYGSFGGATQWKKFGGATADGLHTIAINRTLAVDPALSRFTADRAQFLFNGISGTLAGMIAPPSERYLMAIDGPGKAAPKEPVE